MFVFLFIYLFCDNSIVRGGGGVGGGDFIPRSLHWKHDIHVCPS